MTILDDYIAAVGQLVQGEIPLGEPEKIMAISAAVKTHSKHRPRIVVDDITGDGGFDYLIATYLTSWADDLSVIRSVEYPVDDTKQNAELLDEDEWEIYETSAGKYLRFLDASPPATESARVTYTALHTCTDAACSISAFDEEAVQALAAAFFCDMLATYYAQSQDATIDADSVDHTSKSRDYAARAKSMRKIYQDHMGIKDGSPKAACHVQDQDVNYPGGMDRLTHPRRDR